MASLDVDFDLAEPADVAAFSAALQLRAVLAAVEPADVASFAAALRLDAVLAVAEPADAASFAVALTLGAVMVATERSDRAAIQLAPGWPAMLPLPTLQGYRFTPASAVDRRPMEIGAPRVYRRTKRPTMEVAVQWQLDADQQAALDGFQVSAQQEGAQSFGITLLLPTGLALVVARFRQDKIAMKAMGGRRWQTTATLELLQRPVMSEAQLTTLLDDEGLPPAWPVSLLPDPTLDSWEFTPKPAVARTDDSLPGLPRQRQRSRSSTAEVSAAWELSTEQAALFDGFFRWRSRDGAQWFDFPLVQAIGTINAKVRFLGEADWTPRGNGRWAVTAAIEIRERPVLRADALADSADRALSFLAAQQQARTPFASSLLVPHDTTIERTASGTWTGSWTMPHDPNAGLTYTPVLVTGPLWFPVVSGQPATFQGRVDMPFASMDGYAGRHDMGNPSPPPDFITEPDSVYADGGTNWGSYFVVGSVDGVTQFVARIGPNATWDVTISDAASGSWSFQLVTYASKSNADADTGRIMIGNPWLQSERPGDVRRYWTQGYAAADPQFTSVSPLTGDPYVIAGTLAAFTATPGRTYKILVTEETDVEYAWALETVTGAGAFSISRSQPVGGKIKLRLIEQVDGCSVRVLGQVWAEENAAMAMTAYPDLRVEYRAIGAAIPAFPTSSNPALLSGAWSATLAPVAVGRVSLVDINTKRVFGEYTMPSGLLRSYIVPPQAAGQTPAEVYYDPFNDTCFFYDQAVALIAFLQTGRQVEARRLVQALVDAQNEDGTWPFASDQSAIVAHQAGFIRNGAVAWVCYALLLADLPEYRSWWPVRPTVAAKAALDFLLGTRNAIELVTGGRGQYVDGVLDPDYVVPWWSTEHNLDTWWCLDLADRLYGSAPADYRSAADAIKASLLSFGWDATEGIFWQGGGHGDPTVNDGSHALDTHTWGAAALYRWGRAADAEKSLDRAFALYAVRDEATGLDGLTTFIPQDGYPTGTVKAVWYEGSFGGAMALRRKDLTAASTFMAKLTLGQRRDGSYLYALREDKTNDIHPWPCVIAPAWNVLAASPPDGRWPQIFWT